MSNPISSVDEAAIRPLAHYGPVTALKLTGDYLLCGYGPILKVFHSRLGVEVASHQIFQRNKIHHIGLSSENQVIVVGARSYAITTIDQVIQSDFNVEEKLANEWIICGEFIDQNQVALLNSHNTVMVINTDDYSVASIRHCNEKLILYSGLIAFVNDQPVVAAGTVMDGVIVWDINTCKVVHRLQDHLGLIFGVQISDDGTQLVLCSDDRLVKLYDYATGKLKALGWGHGLRIWGLRFCQQYIVSAGEDCLVRVWQYDGSDDLNAVHVMENVHSGKHIWSVDATDSQLVATGGADGKVRLHHLDDVMITPQNTEEYSMETVKQAGIDVAAADVVKEYVLTDSGMVAVTLFGKLLAIIDSQVTPIAGADEWETKLYNFALIELLEPLLLAVVCTRHGDLAVVDTTTMAVTTSIDGLFADTDKVVNMVAYSHDNDHFIVLVLPKPQVPLVVVKFTLSTDYQVFKLDKPATPFTVLAVAYINNHLIIGGRQVSLAVYDLQQLTPKVTLRRVSAGDTITSISAISHDLALITVRDGTYMVAQVSDDGQLSVIHQNKIARGFIEGGYWDHKQNHLILYGFKLLYFYIWDETTHCELMSHICGGVHRKWRVRKSPQLQQWQFVYTNKLTVYRRQFSQESRASLVHQGTHGREIRDICYDPETKVVVTASEDATVKFSTYDHTTKTIIDHWTMNNHVLGLQRCKFIGKDLVASSAANEEFIVWQLHHLGPVVMVKELTRLPPSADIPDLRIMDFAVIDEGHGKLLIATVYSDSGIKVWRFDVTTATFDLVTSGYYTTCCILLVEFIKFDNDHLHLMIGATDGHLAVWDISDGRKELGAMIIKQQIHQNGVKAWQLLSHINHGYWVVTGGDDNALAVSQLQKLGQQLTLNTVSFNADAASLTITGIAAISANAVAVTLVDQIVRKWQIGGSGQLVCQSARYTTVADTGCCCVDGDGVVMVAGAGVSVFSCI